MSVSNNIRKLRAKTRKSQQELADLLEAERKTYVNWENGKTDIKSKYIPKLAKIFNVDIQDLFKESNTSLKIHQENRKNKDNSINNSIVLVVPDKESINQLAEVLKKIFIRKQMIKNDQKRTC